MKKNMGNTDRAIRLLIVLMIMILYVTNVIKGGLAIGLIVLSGIFILTTLIGFCPLYSLLGINTCKKELGR